MADDKSPITDTNEEKINLNTPDDEKEGLGDDSLPDGLDSSKVKFINVNGGADAHVEIEDEPREMQFCGLSKEELMKYADDPYWVKVRWFLLILFWLVWFAMLAAAIVIIVLAPRCPPRPDLDWWQTSTMYQVYPRSFKDSNGDGVGDLKGIEEKLGYLKSINATAVWLNPIYQSPMVDMGYDISDHKAIDQVFGTMEDFDSLRANMHRHGMKLIMDFVPNHTSRNHTWFLESRKGGADNAFADYYVWHPGKQVGGVRSAPNNWLSVFGGSAWEWDEVRGEYFLHQFLKEQPDLNLRSAAVQDELDDILKFWLEKGVDGFRIDAAAHLFESRDMTQDEPVNTSPDASSDPANHKYLEHTLTMFQTESYEIVTRWRSVLDGFTGETPGNYRVMIVESYGTPNQTYPFFEQNGTRGADMPMNMNLVNLDDQCDSGCVAGLVHNWLNNLPEGRWSNWVVGNHDSSRMASRITEVYARAVNMLQLLLPGTPIIYYGDEIGMVDGVISFEDTQDTFGKRQGRASYAEFSRDPERTPMQWSAKKNAGFSDAAATWLPVNDDYEHKNVKQQMAQGAGMEMLRLVQAMTLVRQQPSFQWGSYEDGTVTNRHLFAFVRQAQGFDGYLVAMNFGDKPAVGDFHASSPRLVPRKGTVAATTGNFSPEGREAFKVGIKIPLDNIHLKPGEGLVFKLDIKEVVELQESQ